MERSFDTVILLDIYGELLANSQREALDMRYNADLSLSEIAEEMGGVTRQSVLYSIKKGEQKLQELENKLGFAERLNTLSAKLDKADALLTAMSAENSDARLDEIKDILSSVRKGL
ncbi:MAG: DNA-binding protein [Oscillospiraceae bacterium]|nr:DNA-binding protein [Oscillospiraceae bacterium]